MAQLERMNTEFQPASGVRKDHGVMAGGGVVPLRMPAGALDFFDRNQYISNIELIDNYPNINRKAPAHRLQRWLGRYHGAH